MNKIWVLIARNSSRRPFFPLVLHHCSIHETNKRALQSSNTHLRTLWAIAFVIISTSTSTTGSDYLISAYRFALIPPTCVAPGLFGEYIFPKCPWSPSDLAFKQKHYNCPSVSKCHYLFLLVCNLEPNTELYSIAVHCSVSPVRLQIQNRVLISQDYSLI